MKVCCISLFYISMQSSGLATALPLDESIQMGVRRSSIHLIRVFSAFHVNEKKILIMLLSQRTSLLFTSAAHQTYISYRSPERLLEKSTCAIDTCLVDPTLLQPITITLDGNTVLARHNAISKLVIGKWPLFMFDWRNCCYFFYQDLFLSLFSLGNFPWKVNLVLARRRVEFWYHGWQAGFCQVLINVALLSCTCRLIPT